MKSCKNKKRETVTYASRLDLITKNIRVYPSQLGLGFGSTCFLYVMFAIVVVVLVWGGLLTGFSGKKFSTEIYLIGKKV